MAKPSTSNGKTAVKDVAVNRKALHDYEILRRIEAGIALTGSEIKSVREGKVSLQEAQYGPAAFFGHEPRRPRRLLLHRSEIRELAAAVEQRGLTLVPLRLYLKDGLAKMEIALARGRKQYDKREAIAKREAEREMERAIKTRSR